LDKIAEKTRPIIHAAKDNIPAFVTALLSGSGNVNAQDSLGKTALMYAVCNNDIDMVQHLFAGQEPTKVPVGTYILFVSVFVTLSRSHSSLSVSRFSRSRGGATRCFAVWSLQLWHVHDASARVRPRAAGGRVEEVHKRCQGQGLREAIERC
jgi:hypothetical protein